MAAKKSGQVTVTTAGTAVKVTSPPAGTAFAVKAHPDNTDTVWVGNDGTGDVSSATGFPLNPGEGIAVDDLSTLYFDADVNGEGACWIKLS